MDNHEIIQKNLKKYNNSKFKYPPSKYKRNYIQYNNSIKDINTFGDQTNLYEKIKNDQKLF